MLSATSVELKERLERHIQGLRLVLSAVIVAVAALRRQNADIDEDIARVLASAGADRLDVEIEGLQALVER